MYYLTIIVLSSLVGVVVWAFVRVLLDELRDYQDIKERMEQPRKSTSVYKP